MKTINEALLSIMGELRIMVDSKEEIIRGLQALVNSKDEEVIDLRKKLDIALEKINNNG